MEVINTLAEQSGFCQRKSKLNALQFLKMVLFDQMTIDQPSLEQHSISILNDHGRKISKQALDKRFNERAVLFVQSLFELYLKRQFSSVKIPSAFAALFSAIRIMDSTEFKLPECLAQEFPGFDGDGTKSCTQIQFEYDILSGRINHFSVGDARISDSAYASAYLPTIKCNELIIRDLGYSKIESFKAIEKSQAYYISRLHPGINIFEKRGKEMVPLSYRCIIKRIRKSGKRYLDIPVYIGMTAKHPVRLVGNLLTNDGIKGRLSKKIYRKNSHNEKYRDLSQLNLFITNVAKKILLPDQVYSLYRIRWQIELIFKTWKSVLKIDQVRKMKADRFKCYLLSKMLWILMSWDICFLFNEEVRQRTNYFLSVYKCFSIIKMQALVIKDFLWKHREKIVLRLKEIVQMLSEYGLKENRKGRTNVMKLLNLKSV